MTTIQERNISVAFFHVIPTDLQMLQLFFVLSVVSLVDFVSSEPLELDSLAVTQTPSKLPLVFVRLQYCILQCTGQKSSQGNSRQTHTCIVSSTFRFHTFLTVAKMSVEKHSAPYWSNSVADFQWFLVDISLKNDKFGYLNPFSGS